MLLGWLVACMFVVHLFFFCFSSVWASVILWKDRRFLKFREMIFSFIALGINGDNRLKRKLAYDFGVRRNLTPARACKMMATPGELFVPKLDRPSEEQIKEQRKKQRGKKHYSSACLEALHHFIKHSPPHVKILPGVECTEAGAIHIVMGCS